MASSDKNDISFLETGQKRNSQVDFFFASLNDMRKDSINTDVILKSKTEQFPAHELVLSAASPYFKRMFDSKFKECLTKIVDFSYVEDETLRTVIDYLYMPSEYVIDDKVEISQLLEILRLAHMFEVKQLSETCWKCIVNELSAENCLTVLKIIAVYDELEKINKIIDLIFVNLKEVVEQKDFENLNESAMKTLLLKFNERNLLIENFFLEALVKWTKAKTDRLKWFSECFFYLNFELISKECIDHLLESEKHLFEDNLKSFIEFQLKPKLKSENEINCKIKEVGSVSNLTYELPILRMFYFGLYSESNSEKSKNALRVITVKNNICTEKIIALPFLLWEGIGYAQYESEFYFLGGLYKTSDNTYRTSNFFLYNWKTNAITWKPLLKKYVDNSFVYVVQDRIYAIGGTFDDSLESPLNIQYYEISKKKWSLIQLQKGAKFRLLSCFNVKNVLYLLCRENNFQFPIYKIVVNACIYHSQLPIYTDFAFQFKLFTTYNDLILIFFCKDSQWFCISYNTAIDICENIPIDAPVSVKFLFCQTIQSNIFFYSEEHVLYQFDYEKRKLTKLMKLRITENDEEKFETIKHASMGKMITISNL